MDSAERGDGTIDRAVALFARIARDGERSPLAAHAAALGIPLSTAYRTATIFRRHGLLAPGRRGHFGPGLGLADLGAVAEPRAILTRAARAPLRRLARSMRATAHLGVLDDHMVTYIVKERGGGGALFTRENDQLEAYCSAIGKVLLAALEEDQLGAYLAAGPFVALTERTMIDPAAIQEEVRGAARRGFAIDDREIADDLCCVAVPVRDRADRIVAAISLSRTSGAAPARKPPSELLACAAAIERRLGRDPSRPG